MKYTVRVISQKKIKKINANTNVFPRSQILPAETVDNSVKFTKHFLSHINMDLNMANQTLKYLSKSY